VILRWEAKLQPARPAGHHREDGQRDVTQLGQSFLFDIAEAVGMREQQRARPLGPNGFWRPAPQRPDALDARRMAFISSGETAARKGSRRLRWPPRSQRASAILSRLDHWLAVRSLFQVERGAA